MTWLDDFSRAIEARSEERHRKTQEHIKSLEEGLPALLESLSKLENETILEMFRDYSQRGYNCYKRERAIWRFITHRVRKEILKRMAA